MNRHPRTPEQRARVSAALLGRKKTRDHVLAIGDGKRGTKHSPEARANMSMAKLGRTYTAEHRAAISAGRMGMTFHPEHRANIARAKLGTKHSPETLAKIGEASRRSWEAKRAAKERHRLSEQEAPQ